MSRLILFYLVFVFSSCADRAKNVKPDWISKRPSDELNWYGIGSVNKSKDNDYRSVARLRAVSEIAEQIKVNIKSKLVDIVEASNDQINEFSSSMIESRVEANLKFIEYFDSFGSKDGQYHVIARLNREKYFEQLALELKKAEERSANLIQSAISEFNGSSFRLLSEAMNEIDQYLDLNPKMVSPFESSGEKAIYDIISNLIYDFSNRINIVTEHKKIVFTPILDSQKKFTLKAIDKKTNDPISNFSLVIGFTFLDSYDTLITDESGRATFSFPDLSYKNSKLNMLLKLDYSNLENPQVKHLMKISSLKFPFNVEILKPVVFIENNIINLGDKITDSSIIDKIKILFENSYAATFNNTLDKSDLKLQINIFTEKRRERINDNFPYIVYASGGISLSRVSDNIEIKNIKFPEQKGSDFDSPILAGKDAIQKIEKKLDLNFTN